MKVSSLLRGKIHSSVSAWSLFFYVPCLAICDNSQIISFSHCNLCNQISNCLRIHLSVALERLRTNILWHVHPVHRNAQVKSVLVLPSPLLLINNTACLSLPFINPLILSSQQVGNSPVDQELTGTGPSINQSLSGSILYINETVSFFLNVYIPKSNFYRSPLHLSTEFVQ